MASVNSFPSLVRRMGAGTSTSKVTVAETYDAVAKVAQGRGLVVGERVSMSDIVVAGSSQE